MTDTEFLSGLALVLCGYILWNDYRSARRRKTQTDKIDHLLTILERPPVVDDEAEVHAAGEGAGLPLRGNPYSGEWKRLGQEERRPEPDVVD